MSGYLMDSDRGRHRIRGKGSRNATRDWVRFINSQIEIIKGLDYLLFYYNDPISIGNFCGYEENYDLEEKILYEKMFKL